MSSGFDEKRVLDEVQRLAALIENDRSSQPNEHTTEVKYIRGDHRRRARKGGAGQGIATTQNNAAPRRIPRGGVDGRSEGPISR